MSTVRATQVATMLTDTTTRRGAFRFLAGVAMASSGFAALGIADADAKKRKRKGKKQDNGICGRGKRARVRVPHDGKIVHTPTLENGRRYRPRVAGVVTGSSSLLTSVGIDAGYIFRPGGDPNLAQDVYGDVDFGLSVDGVAAAWGDHASNHVYERDVVGQGKKLALRLVTEPESGLNQLGQSELAAQRIIANPDLDFTFSGSLTVEILCD